MSHIAFDTLAFANKLKAAGFDPKMAEAQAEAQAELLSGLMDDKLATKNDLKELKIELKTDIKQLRNDMKQLENRLLIKLGGLMVVGVDVLAILFLGM